MYTYARANRILKKADYRRAKIGTLDISSLERGDDFELSSYSERRRRWSRRAATEYAPNAITDYLVSLTSAFSSFYESMPVINSDAKDVRMRLLDAYMQVAKNMFKLVGMDAVESM